MLSIIFSVPNFLGPSLRCIVWFWSSYMWLDHHFSHIKAFWVISLTKPYIKHFGDWVCHKHSPKLFISQVSHTIGMRRKNINNLNQHLTKSSRGLPCHLLSFNPKKWGWNPKNHQGACYLAIFRGPILACKKVLMVDPGSLASTSSVVNVAKQGEAPRQRRVSLQKLASFLLNCDYTWRMGPHLVSSW